MKIKVWYTLYEGGHWIEAEIESRKYKGGCIIMHPAISIDQSLLFPDVPANRQDRSAFRFFLSCEEVDRPIFALSFVEPDSPEFKGTDVIDACLLLQWKPEGFFELMKTVKELEEKLERLTEATQQTFESILLQKTTVKLAPAITAGIGTGKGEKDEKEEETPPTKAENVGTREAPLGGTAPEEAE